MPTMTSSFFLMQSIAWAAEICAGLQNPNIFNIFIQNRTFLVQNPNISMQNPSISMQNSAILPLEAAAALRRMPHLMD